MYLVLESQCYLHECSVHGRIATSYTITIKVVNGINPYENTHTDIFTYVKVPPQMSQYEPLYVHRMTTSDKIDTGQNVHIRVHSGYIVELIASSSYDNFLLSDTHLVLKVQDPSKVGGAYIMG